MTLIDFGISRIDAIELMNELSPRETQIAELMAMGETRLNIANGLGIAAKTFELYLEHVRTKLKVTSHGIPRIWFASQMEVLEP